MRYTVFHLEALLAKSTWSQNPIVSWEWLCKLFISWFCVKKIWSLNNLLWRFILQAFLLNNNNHNNNKKKRIKNMKDRLGILPAFLPSPECMHSGICYDWVFNNLFGAHCCSHYFHVHAPQVMSLKISRWLQLLTVWVDYITERQHLTTHNDTRTVVSHLIEASEEFWSRACEQFGKVNLRKRNIGTCRPPSPRPSRCVMGSCNGLGWPLCTL